MRIGLLEPYVSVGSPKSSVENSAPAHLVGMYNFLRQAGCDVENVGAYSLKLPPEGILDRLQTDKITHAGFCVYDYSPCLS
jgi:hypothetical protein